MNFEVIVAIIWLKRLNELKYNFWQDTVLRVRWVVVIVLLCSTPNFDKNFRTLIPFRKKLQKSGSKPETVPCSKVYDFCLFVSQIISHAK